jgi:hypothetical protein
MFLNWNLTIINNTMRKKMYTDQRFSIYGFFGEIVVSVYRLRALYSLGKAMNRNVSSSQ